MATPNYKGQGQPANSGGWLGSLIGGSPAYVGAGQSASKASYFSSAPAYKPAPVATPDAATSTTDVEPSGFAIVIPRQVIEQP